MENSRYTHSYVSVCFCVCGCVACLSLIHTHTHTQHSLSRLISFSFFCRTFFLRISSSRTFSLVFFPAWGAAWSAAAVAKIISHFSFLSFFLSFFLRTPRGFFSVDLLSVWVEAFSLHHDLVVVDGDGGHHPVAVMLLVLLLLVLLLLMVLVVVVMVVVHSTISTAAAATAAAVAAVGAVEVVRGRCRRRRSPSRVSSEPCRLRRRRELHPLLLLPLVAEPNANLHKTECGRRHCYPTVTVEPRYIL